jgi:hypothetical protein
VKNKSYKNGEKPREREGGVKAKSTSPDIACGTQIHHLARRPSVMWIESQTDTKMSLADDGTG